MKIPFYHVDAFTDKLFAGNPAAVCVLESWLPKDQLQMIANENHLPATAFLVKKDDCYETRWFTPEYEIDLCGHGSMASAHVIFTHLEPETKSVVLKYASGQLQLINSDGLYTLSLPLKLIDEFDSTSLIKGLGATPTEIYQYKSERCLVVYNSEEQLRALNPDMVALQQLDHRGIIVTAPSEKYDFISRTFYPRKAACEDAVTGSSHCLLVPYWAKRLNKNKLHTYQASQRGGELYCELLDNTVTITSKAILYSQGVIELSS